MELSSAGWPIWYGQFTPYGQEITSVPTDFKYKFTGKERDQESGLDYFGARYYANTLNTSISSTMYHLDFGRWMSPDWSDKPEEVPYSILTDPQSLNLYSYVRNHPISAVDTDGHGFCPISMCGGEFYPPNVEAARKDPAGYERTARNGAIGAAAVGVTIATAGFGAEIAAGLRTAQVAATSLCISYCAQVGRAIANALDTNPAAVHPTFNMAGTAASVESRLSNYVLDAEKSGGKAEFFKNVLGFDKLNMKELAGQIKFDPKAAAAGLTDQYGTRFSQSIQVTGANGRVATVTTGWIKDAGTDAVRFLSAYPEKKKP